MIHPTAIIAPGAELGRDVQIGPYAVVEDHVTVGDNCRIGPHVHLTGHTVIGEGTVIHTGAVIGDVPQDVHYTGAVTYTEIGRNCILREYVTIHRGSPEGTTTRVGDGAMIMGMAHLGHNCEVGNGVIIANATLLAGHVHVGDRAFLSGGVLVHQFVRIGTLVMVRGGEGLGRDVAPYCLVGKGRIRGPNAIGLRRAGLSAETRVAIRGAIKLFFRSRLSRPNAIAAVREQYGGIPEVEHFLEFIETTQRGLVPGLGQKDDTDPNEA
ncbi:MAG: acyl-ACP--UDP-N-acetylglucosamine O-acyltransferase [Kiritimatiellaeota bacterium]|nr:acyl-ACP--UDP-N-acetylglucosamine O-acyltransferase [Kiritimatiellota bacterium]